MLTSPLFVILIIIISQAPSFLPTESEKIDDDKRFEVSETIGGETAQGNKTTYGLTRMAPKDDEAKVRYENKKKEQDKNKKESFIGKRLAEKELDAFKEDVEDLPEQASIEAYESMPIEDFGAAMLRGMGWKEGEGVGRNAKSGRADPVEFVPRMGRLGLGADTMDVPGATLRKNNNNNDNAAYDIAIVPMDGYHYYRSQLEKMYNPQHALAKRGAPFTFDSERFVNDIVNLRKSGSGSFPSFDHGKGDPVENDILVEYKRHKIILVEGNYLFLPEQPWSRLLDETCFDEAWYVNCPVDEATKRVIDRHVRTGKTKETAELRAYSNDLVNAKLVDANKRFADVMIPNAKRFS